MKVYVGTYGKYASDSICGKWVDLDDFDCKDDFLEECRSIHCDEDDPEFMFQDCEYDFYFEKIFFDESCISENYWTFKDECKKYCIDPEVAGLYATDVVGTSNIDDISDFVVKASESYRGVYDSEADYEEQMAEECGELERIPDFIRYHIDWEGVARDDYDMSFVHDDYGKVHVFCLY